MTPVAEFRDAVRFLLGDHAEPFEYADGALDRGVRTVVKGGLVAGYALNAAQTHLDPAVTAAADYMKLATHVAVAFARAMPRHETRRTPDFAFSRSRGDNELAGSLAIQLHQLEAGGMLGSWLSLSSWLEGQSGVGAGWLDRVRARVKVPLSTITV